MVVITHSSVTIVVVMALTNGDSSTLPSSGFHMHMYMYIGRHDSIEYNILLEKNALRDHVPSPILSHRTSTLA